MGLFWDMRRTSRWDRRTYTSVFLFTHVYLYSRSLLWVSFETCVVPHSWVGSALGAPVRTYSSSHMHISIAGLFYGFLFMCRTSGRSGSISCHTCTSLFAHLCLFCRSLLRIFLTHVSYLGAQWEHFLSHMYVSFRTFISLLQVSFTDFFWRMCRTLGRSGSISSPTRTSHLAHVCLFCRSLL